MSFIKCFISNSCHNEGIVLFKLIVKQYYLVQCRLFWWVTRIEYHTTRLMMLTCPICSGPMGHFKWKLQFGVVYEAFFQFQEYTYQSLYFAPKCYLYIFELFYIIYFLPHYINEFRMLKSGPTKTRKGGLWN